MAGHKPWKKLGSGALDTQDTSKGLGHIVPVRVYKAVFFSLLLLTFITVWAAAQHVSVVTHLFIALAIATVKAGVVTYIFMHLKYESKVIWGIVIYPIFIIFLMVVGTMGDTSVKNRAQPYAVKPEVNPAALVKDTHGAGHHSEDSDSEDSHSKESHKDHH